MLISKHRGSDYGEYSWDLWLRMLRLWLKNSWEVWELRRQELQDLVQWLRLSEEKRARPSTSKL